MQVTFKIQDSDLAQMQEEVSPDLKLGEIRQAVMTRLGFPEHQPCQLILERTGEKLGDGLTLEEADVRENDKLILSPPTDKKKPPPPEATPTPTPPPSPPPAVLLRSPEPSPGLDWRTAVIIGGVIGVFGLIGLVLSQNKVVVVESTPKPSPISPAPPKPSPVKTPVSSQPSPKPSISRQKAVNLIQKYLEAKKVMFAPPYNRQILAEIGTSEFYEKAVGGIDWLQRNGAYYRYNVQRVDSVQEFVSQGNEATIKVRITEDYTLYNSDGSIDGSSSNFRTLTVIYNMRLINGNLKISASK
ncbi:ARC6/PARC6 family protein [Okeania sp. SIO1I7]|uniref:ARC6/PARC6 family protein n=1 Tax=Okeania sp. SIO1I7 TaxID=2607772 RepID=UPI0013FB8170|nr:ARC6/PARC6 family protein [Okeania sp. SIO1I7]NET27964.1 DUF4101 domain-containing protein [Okeania sp. SIO1I7]